MENITYKDQIYFHIPAIFNRKIFDYLNSPYQIILYEDIIKENINLSLYGCPNVCTWNGGRLMIGEVLVIEDIENLFSLYTEYFGFDISLTFTNSLLEKNDLYDRYGNALLELTNRYKDHVSIMVVSEILEDYIRNKYPDIKIIRSIVKGNKPEEKEIDKYDMIVIPKFYNHNRDYLKDISNKCTIELLCDEPCDTSCDRRKEHYEVFNRSQLFQYSNGDLKCTCQRNKFYNELMILPEEINDYIDLGIKHFKLSGRENIAYMIESCVRYLVREEKQIDTRMLLYRNCKDLL